MNRKYFPLEKVEEMKKFLRSTPKGSWVSQNNATGEWTVFYPLDWSLKNV